MASAKDNAGFVDNNEVGVSCEGDNCNHAPVAHEPIVEMDNSHLGGTTTSKLQAGNLSVPEKKKKFRKLLTIIRQLMVKFKHLNDNRQSVKKSESASITSEFNEMSPFLTNSK